MADDLTLGELGRRLDDRIADVRDDIAAIGRRVDGRVAQDVYQVQHEAVLARLTALETLRTQDAARVAGTRRWLIGAVVVPLVAVLLAYVLTKGGS
ncbi:hypothetical protein [Streptomyces sp. NRRL F-5123]|uniref:hypothetical protein n=1 Tax=Streptomyces sp. NRRL F-5123 TaxID=1463856 RepID=UPI0004E10947|nr:hypothetical protein [Streptomyces sp. NRRL F-5123]